MYLTKEEEKLLQGEYGSSLALAMKLLVTLGEVFGAERMIKIASAQISGVSYKNIGDAGIEFLKDIAKERTNVKVFTTLNPAGMDLDRWKEMGVPDDFAKKQNQIIDIFRKLGISITCTCTPYLAGNKPKFCEHVAWAESSAVAYANSVLGARTNREGGPSALASAITGLTPLYGYHLERERVATFRVSIEGVLRNELDYSALGYYVGKTMKKGVPLFTGIKRTNIAQLKALSAGLGTSSAIALYHIKDVTKEAAKAEPVDTTIQSISVNRKNIEETIESLTNVRDFDVICIGCPHCSLSEIRQIYYFLQGKTLKKKLWIFTSRKVYDEAAKRGYVKGIEKVGGKLIRDTCMVVAPIRDMGVEKVLTNSCKAAYYMPPNCKVKTSLLELKRSLKVAT